MKRCLFTTKKQKTMTSSLYNDDLFVECYAIVKGKMANKMPLSEVEEVMAENIRRFYAAVHCIENQDNKR